MDAELEKAFCFLTEHFLEKNYNYVYLKTMLQKAKNMAEKDATLITGSSYALSGIKETAWNNAVSCSMSSQDVYYDFKCAYDVITACAPGTYKKCFIVKGYYAACHDLSSSPKERERIISNVYYPIFGDAHNWSTPVQADLWEGLVGKGLSVVARNTVEKMAITKMEKCGTFYSTMKSRGGTVFNLGDKKWHELSAEEKDYLGNYRANCHNKLFQHQGSMSENREIMKDYVHFLHLNDILPVFVIAPFVASYNQYIRQDMKDSVLDMLGYVSGEVHFVDFNQDSPFDDTDFVDTDHLDEKGAWKMSRILVDFFGK